MSTDVMFRPIRGLEKDLMNVPHTEGALLISTDTGKMWVDAPNSNRVSLGGDSGAALLYGKATEIKETDEINGQVFYLISREDLENSAVKPRVNDLILNSDGAFYRILTVGDIELTCSRLAVSGSGGGGGSVSANGISIELLPLKSTTVINKHEAILNFIAYSGLKDDGETPIDSKLSVSWTLATAPADGSAGVVYDSGNLDVTHGEQAELEFGTHLRESTTSTLTLVATALNQPNSSYTAKVSSIVTMEMTLNAPEQFSTYAYRSANTTLSCIATGRGPRILEYYIDGELAHVETLNNNSSTNQSYTATGLSHGMHKISIQLSQATTNGEKFNTIEPFEYEMAVVDPVDNTPIIWVGDFNETYYNYDNIKIPFYTYTPNKTESTVVLLKGITELDTRTIANGNRTASIWQITDASLNVQNSYFINVLKPYEVSEGENKYVSREVSFEVKQDPNRDMTLTNSNALKVSFNSAGRSNNETKTRRQTWSYTDSIPDSGKTYNGIFENFNWYNNGWILDEDNNSVLRISNGAKFSIPIGKMILNQNSDVNNQSATFEFEFKVRNVQDYSNLIKEHTRYVGDTEYWNAFQEQEEYDNYDSYLKYISSLDSAEKDYDTITKNFDHVERVISSKPIAFCEYFDVNNHGIKLGPQDGFFKCERSTVNFNYVEDELINLSIIFDGSGSSKRVYVYVQGVLTAVTSIESAEPVLEFQTNNIVFSSDYCDVDLYKFRVYNKTLSVKDILTNYAVDRISVLDYDYTDKLLDYYQDGKEEYYLKYSAMKEWNNEHPDDLLMPYLILDTGTESNALPYNKSDKKLINMSFVNPSLDRYYQTGVLEELANAMSAEQKNAATKEGLTPTQYYYKHHCPSFTSIDQMVNLAVQGTSSQGYPRRNYKAKTKDANDNIQMYMNKGPFAELFASGKPEDLEKCHLDYFYFNNYSVGTTKFTLKVDYMESSGTYNMGLANLVHTAYTKHPLDDYISNGAFAETSYVQATENEAVEGTKYYVDEKGKTEVTFTEEQPYEANKYFKPSYTTYNTTTKKYPIDTIDLRTNVQGFPVMTFWKYGSSDNDYRFIGRYNMLLDKGSDEAYGFKPDKKIVNNFLKKKAVRNMTECWEYSNNQRGYCSFKDPLGRHKLSFNYTDGKGNTLLDGHNAPLVVNSYEYRYNKNDDLLDYIYGDDTKYEGLQKDYTPQQLQDSTWKTSQIFEIYKNWEKVNQWVWSTYLENVPSESDRASGKATARKIMNYNLVAIGTPYDSNKTYYDKYEDEIADMSKYIEDNNISGEVYIGEPIVVTYGDTSYEYETKEYRKAKFTNELTDHFDLEYCLVYFVITEVMLAYDSRGKNCMMASWGPLKPGGDYIWYPIFYDMDTQLGINNTGIPSFDYFANATIDGTFSTSDSILWNNLYECFYEQIKGKYNTLRGADPNNTRNPGNGPLSSVKHIENWYLAQPFNDETNETQREAAKLNHIEMCGARPLAMFNMDEFYKYISITNSRIGYQDRDTGAIKTDNGGYFYALQGDRSLSRQQFLSKRINFIDSWLSVRTYVKDQGAQIYGRTGANNDVQYSDKWITENTAAYHDGMEISQYYQTTENGEILLDTNGNKIKTNYLDADNYIAITPYQNSYVKVYVDDTTNGSVQYNGEPIRYDIPGDLYNAIFKDQMKENLTYIVGGNVIQDIGDISLMYWSLFNADNVPHLSRLLLGNDHIGFYNRNAFTDPVFDANGKNADGTLHTGKPLLKEVNLSGIEFINPGLNFDFTSSEKLRIFKGLRSNFASVSFAEGVALHTLYLPQTVTALVLTEADNLNTVLSDINVTDMNRDDYYSKYNALDNTWTAKQGLYIEGLTNFDLSTLTSNSSCNIATVDIAGGVLNYGLYDIVYKLYKIYKEGAGGGSKDLKLSLKEVNWSPYQKLDADSVYDASATYVIDDGHYGFKSYEYNESNWLKNIQNGLIYVYDPSQAANIDKITDIEMLKDFISRAQFKDTVSSGNSTPILTGTIYINNSEDNPIDENDIRNILLNDTNGFSEEKLDIHFAHVDKKYKAVFVQEEDGVRNVIGTEVLSSPGKFTSPYVKYKDTIKKDNYDFKGWSTTGNVKDTISSTDWDSSSLTQATEGNYDYTFYAVFERHGFNIEFKSGSVKDGFTNVTTISTLYGDYIQEPLVLPYLDNSSLEEEKRYSFVGWTQNKNSTIAASRSLAKTVNVNKILATSDMIFYAVFVEENVYDSVLDEKYLEFKINGDSTGYRIARNPQVNPEDLKGKITLPASYKGLPVIGLTAPTGAGTRKGAFTNCENLTYIFFEQGSSIKEFGAYSFMECKSLKKVELPISLEQIGNNCFTNCTSLQNASFVNNIKLLGTNAFSGAGNNSTVELVFGANLQTIGNGAFNSYVNNISKVYFGTSVDGSAFNIVNSSPKPIFSPANLSYTYGIPEEIIYYFRNDSEKNNFETWFSKNYIVSSTLKDMYDAPTVSEVSNGMNSLTYKKKN